MTPEWIAPIAFWLRGKLLTKLTNRIVLSIIAQPLVSEAELRSSVNRMAFCFQHPDAEIRDSEWADLVARLGLSFPMQKGLTRVVIDPGLTALVA